MRRMEEFLNDLYDLAPDAVVVEQDDGSLVIITNLQASRFPEMKEIFVHDMLVA